jgi:hypothetical protein
MKCQHEPCRPSTTAERRRGRGRGWPNGSKNTRAAPTNAEGCARGFGLTAGVRPAALATPALTGAVFMNVGARADVVWCRPSGYPTCSHPVTAGVTAVLLRRLQRRPLRAARRAVCRFPRWIGGFKACESLAPQLSKAVSWMRARRLSSFSGADCGRLRKESGAATRKGAARISHQSTMRTAVDPPPPSLHLYFEGAVARNRPRNPHGTAAAPAGPVGASASRRSFSTM